MLGDVTARGRDPEVGITVHEATITLRIVAEADSEDEAQSKIRETRSVIFQRIGEYAFGDEDDELEHVVIRALRSIGARLAVMEVGTGGLLAHRLTEVRDSADCFVGGLVLSASDTTGKIAPSLDVSGIRHVATSREAAEFLAGRCRDLFGADYSLAVGALSHVDDHENAGVPPRVWIALADNSHIETSEISIAGDPAILKSRVVKSILNFLRLKLLREHIISRHAD
jgi:nicotinamide-nucleotide amidase